MRSGAITEVTDSTTHVTKGIYYALIVERITCFPDNRMADIRILPGSI